MDNATNTLSWKLMIFEVLFLVTSSHGLYSGADHYWPLNEIGYSRVYDHRQPKEEKWHGIVKGEAEITWSPPQLALDLYGKDAWVDLGSRYNSCYVDVEYCNQTGLTTAVWVAFREAYTTQGLIEFESGACGLNLARTNDSEMNATIRSMELGKTWSVQSVNASIGAGGWHHVALTWNFTGEVYLFINGTRLDMHREVISNVSCAGANCTCDWSIKVGTTTQTNSSVQSYSSMKIARLGLWNYVLNNQAIVQLANEMQGLYFSNRGCYYPWIANLQFCYHIQSEWKQSWYGARQTCDSYLGNLVSIGSQEEYDFLEEAFRNKEVSSCLHIGLQNSTGSSEPSWVDGNVWSFSKLNSSYELVNVTDACVFREVDGLWYFSKCSEECGFVCKRYRAVDCNARNTLHMPVISHNDPPAQPRYKIFNTCEPDLTEGTVFDDGMFRNAEFHCRVRRHDHQLVNHRLSIRWVKNELACAIECLIYGSGCKSYNFKQNHALASDGQNICELSSSNQDQHPSSLIHSTGFQYCERLS